ncbi:DotU/TssL family secretion system protein [Candidatus Binatia bacterium]|nr:DotU/TssL family secretion system protein [Candidatus Binatia bacterium]
MSTSLRDLFTPVISYVLLFTRSTGTDRSFARLQEDLDRLFAEQERLVKRHEIPAADYDRARFAVVAWADEAIVGHAHDINRDLAQNWKRAPLQKRFYGTTNAGEEFFERLAEVPVTDHAVREIYHLCLCLGFRGRYYDESQEHKLIQVRRELAQHLPDPIPDLLELERSGLRLTPQPYEVPEPPPRRPARSLALVWATLASAALAALVFFLLPRGPAPRTPPEILADLQTRVRGFECSAITAGFDDATATATLAGRVESETQRAQVTATARAVPEVRNVRDNLSLMPRPFCEVVELLEPLRVRAQQAGTALAVTLPKGCNTVYRLGDSLVFEVSAKRPLQYVYLDYYVADRETVGHLYPGAGEGEAGLTGTTLTVGGPDSATKWQVEPPFGTELVTAISSPKPILGTRPPTERAGVYLDSLRAVLPSDGTSTEVGAAYCFISTEGKD